MINKTRRPFDFGKGFLGDKGFLGEPLFGGGFLDIAPFLESKYSEVQDKKLLLCHMKRLLQEFWVTYESYQKLENRR